MAVLTKREYISVEYEASTALITVNRPPVNAWNMQVQVEMESALIETGGQAEIRAVIITGGGGRAFIAGADLAMINGITPEAAADFSRSTQRVLGLIAGMDQVVIAAVEGLALGGGCEVALACDIRVADEKAVFGLPEVGLGLIPGAGGTQRLPRLLGRGKALELILTGDPVSADEAFRIGLVERLASAGQAVAEARRMVERIALRGPAAVAKAKRAVTQGLELPLAEGLKLETRAFRELFETEDHQEGIQAFLDKRPPNFSGR